MDKERERLGYLSPSSLPTRCGLVEAEFYYGTVVFRQVSPRVSLGLELTPCSVNLSLFLPL